MFLYLLECAEHSIATYIVEFIKHFIRFFLFPVYRHFFPLKIAKRNVNIRNDLIKFVICCDLHFSGKLKKTVSPFRWESFPNANIVMISERISIILIALNKMAIFKYHQKIANSVNSLREREEKKVTNEKLNFRISISVKINLFKNVGEATSIGIFGNNTSMQYLKCVRWCMFIFFLWISWTKSLYIKIHFIWHAFCIAIHWIEPFKRVYIDSIGNNQTSKRGTNTFFLAYFFFNSMHTIVMHHKFNGRFTLLHVILYTKKSLVWFHPGVVVVFFFSIYTENTWPVSHRFNLIARPNNIIVYFLKSNRSKRKIFSNFMR